MESDMIIIATLSWLLLTYLAIGLLSSVNCDDRRNMHERPLDRKTAESTLKQAEHDAG
jgi:Tfp pilus assembly protein PilX